MQTNFNESLKFFQQKETETEMDLAQEHGSGERQMRNGRGNRKNQFVPCIAKELYDEPPQSDFIILQMFYNLVHASFKVLSKFRMGQIIISILDYYMIKIENTLDFCLPDNSEFAAQRIIDQHKRTLPIQDRPLSWLFFIPALIFLRMFRFTMSIYCIMAGKGEVTAQHMQIKVIAFRRYYRSIRHYAVDKWTDEDKKLVEDRKRWLFWRFYYRIYESIFMTKPIVEFHHQHCSFNDATEERRRHNRLEKQSLNVSTADTDDDLNANEILEKYAHLDDSLTVDPDYKPDESKDLNETVDDFDSDDGSCEEEILSPRKLNDCKNELGESSMSNRNTSPSCDVISEDQSESDKSNEESSLTPSQMNELESEIMTKILNYFKQNYDFAPKDIFTNDVFYSPIGSPPENGIEMHGDSDVHLHTDLQRTKIDAEVNNNHENTS